ncbi:MAG TPA: tRNA (adenosine(37)-N6)-threonylcarbamoyltransferase complex dimerization subunit type 1 TsaB [Candidatus Bathyarchaeia archaeon]|nr:tRNA (adenosine(37)-N6)-threonylcarbamoyltransferase complex dimerization subunit type 1 TsaB [Candidatus Bathyarchaeia archaeon]
MRLLAVESATLSGGAALLDGDRLLGEVTLNIAITHSERLLAAVDRLLADCGMAAADLEGLAVSVGPGSFTGLRVGLATVKGLSMALDLPVAPVPTLDALAARVPFADAPVCPILDARKGEVYLSLYRWRGDRMCREREYEALPPRIAAAGIAAPTILLGDGIEACRPWLPEHVRIAPTALRLPSAATVGELGHATLAAGAGVDAESLTPLYLRPSEAELKARRT